MASGKTTMFDPSHVAEVLRKGDGIMSTAAKKLKCTRQTVANYIANYPECKEAHEEARAATDDFVESALIQRIREKDTTATIFYAKTRLKDRGYVERIEQTGKDGEAIKTESVVFYIPSNGRN